MSKLEEIRQKYPQYNDIDDETLSTKFHEKFYSDMGKDQFNKIIGYTPGPKPDVAIDIAKGFGQGANTGIDAILNVASSPIRVPINAISDALGYGEAIPELNLARRANVAGGPETAPGRYAEAIGEVAGGSVLPTAGMLKAGQVMGNAAKGIIGQYAASPGRAATLDAASDVGAGVGVGFARENDLGPVAEVGLGLAGGFAVPNAANLGKRTYEGVKSGARYADRSVRSALNPEQAAIDSVADRLVATGVNPDDIRAAVQPPRSANLQARGFEDSDLADIISRQMRGESASDVAKDYAHLVDPQGRKLTAATAKAYFNRFNEQNPTPMNVIDITKEIAGEGAAGPVTRLGRATSSLSGDESADAAQKLLSRQEVQPGRVRAIARQAAGGSDFETTKTAGLERLSKEASKDYKAFYKEPDLAINKLDDLMEDPLFKRAVEQGQRQERIAVIRDNQTLARQGKKPNPVPEIDAEAQVFSPQTLDYIQRQLRIAGEGFANDPNKANHAKDLRQVFLDRIEDHYPKFRGIRTKYAQGLGEFGADGALDAGRAMTKRLGEKADTALREFQSMTPAQQELFRLGFARQIMDDASNVQFGANVANKFNTDAVRQIVRKLWSGDKALRSQGTKLLKDLRRESITTKTKNDVLAGSRTAELESDMGRLQEGAKAAADVLTGQFGNMLNNLSTRLTTQLGRKGAAEVMKILTETDPKELLPILNRLARSAKTAKQRQAYVATIREYRRIGRRPASDIGTATIYSKEDK